MSVPETIVELKGVTKRYARRLLVQSTDFAVEDVDIAIRPGEVVGILGESGSGKSTLANIITRLTPFDGGTYRYKGRDVSTFSRGDAFAFKSDVQIVFQDPYGSLNPRATAGASVRESLMLHKRELSASQMSARVIELFDEVGLPREGIERYPHEFSGGQRQRVAIARALAVDPELLVCDEPLSSLDVSIQAQVLELFVRLIGQHKLTMVFISHDINVARLLCDRVFIMHNGRIVEDGPTEAVLNQPTNEYTARLLASVY